MPCLLVLLVVGLPRLVLVLMWLFSHALDHAYHNLAIPLLGFLFLPITTIVYAWMLNGGMPLQGGNLLILIIAVVLDVVSSGGGARHWSRR
jgi:hypothetical protein